MSPDQECDSVAARQCKAVFEAFAHRGALADVGFPEVWEVLRAALRGDALEPLSGALRLALHTRVDPAIGCHVWVRGTIKSGYGMFSVDGKNVLAHRLAYELAKGPIPPGLVVDHLCRNRACCNPAHLEAVTQGENTRRGKSWAGRHRHGFCNSGHRMTGNKKSGQAYCEECARARALRNRWKNIDVI